LRNHPSTPVRILVGTAVAALALLVTTACGSSGNNASNGAGSNAAGNNAPSAASGMDAGTPSADGGAMGGSPASVTIQETKAGGADHYAFAPTSVKVTDDQLTVVNKSDENQKITCTGPATASATVGPGKTGTIKFDGDGDYNCTTNKGAKLTIDVE
jgi:ABC-type Fe3+-hydroxamate transport system substrate-binding protein